MKTGILLSACMMVRNEEKNIERCLKSICGFVDEIVVVDTGSTDDTLKIAKRYDARIYHHPWEDDFSLHRNQSMSHARGKWVMIIDADEELVLEKGIAIKQMRDFFHRVDMKYPAAAMNVKDIQKGANVLQFSSTRFFRKGLVEYRGRVHNQPNLKVPGQAVLCTLANIHHYGYDLTPEQKEAKFKRTSTLLLKQVEQGEMTDMLPYFYLCQLYADRRLPKEAVEYGEKYWANKDKVNPGKFCESIYFTMTKQYMKIGDKQKTFEWLQRGIENLPGDLDMSIAALEYGVWIGNPGLQVNAANDFIQLYQKFQQNPNLKGNRFIYALRPEALAYALYHKTVVQINDGTAALKNLIAILNTLNPAFREGTLRELEEALSKSAFPVRFHKDDPAEAATQQESKNFVMGAIH